MKNYVFLLPTLSCHCFSNTLYGADIKRTRENVPSRPNTHAALQPLSKPAVASLTWHARCQGCWSESVKDSCNSPYLQFASFLCNESVERKNEDDSGNSCQGGWAEMLDRGKDKAESRVFRIKCICGWDALRKILHFNIPARGRRDIVQSQWEPARQHWSTPQSPWASECLLKPDSQSRPRCKSSWQSCLSPKTGLTIIETKTRSSQCIVYSIILHPRRDFRQSFISGKSC